jgi:serine/threonine protein kinase
MSPMIRKEEQLASTERFEIRKRLGEGAMGVVYEAFDRERTSVIAIKALRSCGASADPSAMLRFKNEFRALQGLQHPNLVRLGELFEDHGQLYFTMELIEGVDLLTWLRCDRNERGEPPARPPARTPAIEPDAAAPLSALALGPTAPVERPPLPTLVSLDRLRDALRQLASGIGALHRVAKVHRDVKPSNILVQRDGRLVLLDFGLITDVTRLSSTDEGIVGTTAYMAPEQAAAKPISPAVDCYAIGVLLYQVLTGRLPFEGNMLEILVNKQRGQPTPPSRCCPSVPRDLDQLCIDLLAFDPASRPTTDDILSRLGGSARPAGGGRLFTSGRAATFVGREAELAELRRAFDDTLAGQSVTVNLVGESGLGKTALADSFVERLREDYPDAVVLQGRCYERESVPFKAFDGIIDALSHYMLTLPFAEAASLLPLNAALLTPVFPVLGRVRAMSSAPRPYHESPDPQQLRKRVFGAVREFLTRLAERHPVVLVVDDFQWADGDSLALFDEVTHAPDAPRVLALLIATVGATEGPCSEGARCLRISGLSANESQRLARLLIQRESGDPRLADLVATEAAGHPLFIDELVRHAARGGRTERPAPLQLVEALRARIEHLDPEQRRLLELVAVAGGQLAQETVLRATGMAPPAFDKSLASLRDANLVMTKGERRSDMVEPYHERVREAVLAHLPESTRRQHHELLALALEASGHADPEALATYWRGAGEVDRALTYTILAADRAARALAFDRAVRWYREAIDVAADAQKTDVRPLRLRLAGALAHAGRGVDAAAVYLAAAEGATSAEALELERLAAEQLLRCGHVDEALDLYGTTGRALGHALAATPLRAMASLQLSRMRIRLRGLRYEEHDETQVTRRDLLRLDGGFFLGLGLLTVHPIVAMELLARLLMLALSVGEPARVARAIALAATTNAAQRGAPGRKRTAVLVETAEAIAARIDSAHTLGLVTWAAGAAAYFEGRFRASHELHEKALAIYRDRCTGVVWETATAQAFALWSLHYLGELAEIGRRLPALLHEASARGDWYDATHLRTSHTNLWWLAADEPKQARWEVIDAMTDWSPRGFHLQHYYALHALAQCDLYRGQAETARERVLEPWRQIREARLLDIVTVRVELFYLRARTALATAAARRSEAPSLLAAATADARQLAAQKMPWSIALAALIDAGVAALDGRPHAATVHYRDAVQKLAQAEMHLHCACARRRLGQLMGGDAGAAQVEDAERWMRAQAIRNPSRMCGLFAPANLD